jgi:hypothetical protein
MTEPFPAPRPPEDESVPAEDDAPEPTPDSDYEPV